MIDSTSIIDHTRNEFRVLLLFFCTEKQYHERCYRCSITPCLYYATYCGIYLVYLALGDRSHGAQLTGTLTRARICLVLAMIKIF